MAIQDIDLGTVIENGEDGDVARTAFTKVNENFDDLDARVTYIESLDIGTVTSVNDILPVDGNVDLTPADIGAATAAQGAKADTAVQADVFATALNQKVDKVEGYQLSQEDYTTAEKDKLASLESSLFLGVYSSLAELEAAHPTSDRPGEYAFIPTGVNIYMFVWDNITEMWVTLGSGSEAITAEQVKTLYESNPDTNAFTNAEKTKLGDIQPGAQVNVATNISQGTRTDTTVSINSSTGTGATLVGASMTEAGIMTAADKVKVNNIPATTDGLAEGSTNLYFTGERVRQTLLTGFSTGTAEQISAVDTILAALGKLQGQIDAAGGASDMWQVKPIGEPFPLFTHLTGVDTPPTDNPNYRYIKLTASDSYNTGVLTSESVSGSAPLVQATAVISDPVSPMNGQTIRLINTERRFIRPGSDGAVEADALQNITGSAGMRPAAGLIDSAALTGAFKLGMSRAERPSLLTAAGYDIGFDASLVARTANETRVKSLGATYYMRIR